MKNISQTLGSNLVSMYLYDASVGNTIPVFVLSTVDFAILDEMKENFEGENFIMLTEDDVTRGNDIFPLKFLHMKKHSRLEDGKDILKDLHIDKKHLRTNIESELRNKRVQLRESYLSFDGREEFIDQVIAVMDMIWEGIEFLAPKLAHKENEALKKQIYDLINSKNTKDNKDQVAKVIQSVNDLMTQLIHDVDKLKI